MNDNKYEKSVSSPKVSVIVPVYGVEKYIERCARSLFEQTLDDIEFIFVDDCTADESVVILQKVLMFYPYRVKQTKILHHDVNMGLPTARQTGLKVATGNYIAHCDSDDWVDKDMYRQMYTKAVEEQADVVVCDYAVSDGNNITRILSGCQTLNIEAYIKDLLLQRNSWSLWNKLFHRTSCYKENIMYPSQAMGEDMAITIQLLLNCKKMSYVHQYFYYYYSNEDSISRASSIDKRFRNYVQNKDNTEIVISSIEREGKLNEYKNEIIALKWRAKSDIWNMPYNKERRKLWIKTYKEINNMVLVNKNIPIKGKIKFILAYLGLYPSRYL